MSIRQHRASDPTYASTFLPPSGTFSYLNEDWERGPVALNDGSLGRDYQNWHLTFANSAFTLTPATTGPPVVLDLGEPIDSVQCSITFDQNSHIVVAWIDSLDRGQFYYYDTAGAQDWIIWNFASGVGGTGLTMDDKRAMEVRACDVQLFYTRDPIANDQWILYNREQRDRFEVEYEIANPSKRYIKFCGMNDSLRVQIETVNDAL